jgi:hypothetical protein
MGSMRALALTLGTAVAVTVVAPMAVAQPDDLADTAFDSFRTALVEDLAQTRSRLATAGRWVADPDWYLVQTPDSGVVGVRRSELALHAALLADPAFAARVDVLDDPVHAWDEGFTMSLGLIRDEGGDPAAAAERLASGLSQTESEKKTLLRQERQFLRADRDQLVAAIAAFDAFASGLGLEPATAIDTSLTPSVAPSEPLDLVIAFRDQLVADREALQARVAACRTAIDEEDVVAFGEQESFKFRDELRLSGVVVFDLPTLPDYADFPAHLRDDPAAWDHFDTIFAPEAARSSSLLAAMLLFSFWQDWPPDMRASAAEAWPIERRSAQQDRALCRPLLGLLRPERDRLDTAIAALDEYLVLAALDTEPVPEPVATPEPQTEPSELPNPFADL